MWFNIDPLAEAEISNTPYNYCANNPVNFTDPNGMQKVAFEHGRGTGVNSIAFNAWNNWTSGGDGADYDPMGYMGQTKEEYLAEEAAKEAANEEGEVLIWDMDWGVDVNAVQGGFVDSWEEMATFLINVSKSQGVEIAGFVMHNIKEGKVKYWIHPWDRNTKDGAVYNKKLFPEMEDYYFEFQVHSHTSLNLGYPENPSPLDRKRMYDSNLDMVVIGHRYMYYLDSTKEYDLKTISGTFNGNPYTATAVDVDVYWLTRNINLLDY